MKYNFTTPNHLYHTQKKKRKRTTAYLYINIFFQKSKGFFKSSKIYFLDLFSYILYLFGNNIPLERGGETMKKTQINEAKNFMNSMKMEISSELGINNLKTSGANRTAKENGRIGGQMTKKLVELGKQHLNNT